MGRSAVGGGGEGGPNDPLELCKYNERRDYELRLSWELTNTFKWESLGIIRNDEKDLCGKNTNERVMLRSHWKFTPFLWIEI